MKKIFALKNYLHLKYKQGVYKLMNITNESKEALKYIWIYKFAVDCLDWLNEKLKKWRM